MVFKAFNLLCYKFEDCYKVLEVPGWLVFMWMVELKCIMIEFGIMIAVMAGDEMIREVLLAVCYHGVGGCDAV